MAGHRVRFGPFEADLTTGELRREGQLVPLQQQPFRILAMLLQRPGELVTRDAIRGALWPHDTHVIFDRSITSAVRKLREALGERADRAGFIETLPGRGYRFIGHAAPVIEWSGTAAPAAAGPPPVAARPIRASRWLPWARVAAIALLAMGLGSIEGRPTRADGASLEAARRLSAYACLLKSMGRHADALDAIQQAHALAPASAGITAQVGFYLHAAGRYDEEFPMLHRAVAQDPGSREAWLHMGLAYARRDRFDEAVAALERATRLTGGGDRAEWWLAWARTERTRRA